VGWQAVTRQNRGANAGWRAGGSASRIISASLQKMDAEEPDEA
jgi:hypothetical protein